MDGAVGDARGAAAQEAAPDSACSGIASDAAAARPPWNGFRFFTELSVRFSETDAQGVAHNAAYLVWFEVGRVEYLARFRGGYQDLQREGLEALTIEAHARYLAPVRFADVLRVHLRCVDVRGARFRFEYAIERAADGIVVSDGWTNHACVDARSLRPTRLPAWLVREIARTEVVPAA
jgi:acyl-CoA thioester hydrolase